MHVPYSQVQAQLLKRTRAWNYQFLLRRSPQMQENKKANNKLFYGKHDVFIPLTNDEKMDR